MLFCEHGERGDGGNHACNRFSLVKLIVFREVVSDLKDESRQEAIPVLNI